MPAAVRRYRCCKHCGQNRGLGCLSGHIVPCAYPGYPGRMPIDPETEG